MVTHEELTCLKEYLPLPKNLDFQAVAGTVDINEAFYVPTTGYFAHEVLFTVQGG